MSRSFADLPEEMWTEISSHCTVRSIVNLSELNHNFRSIMTGDTVWSDVCRRHLSVSQLPSDCSSWLEAYKLITSVAAFCGVWSEKWSDIADKDSLTITRTEGDNQLDIHMESFAVPSALVFREPHGGLSFFMHGGGSNWSFRYYMFPPKVRQPTNHFLQLFIHRFHDNAWYSGCLYRDAKAKQYNVSDFPMENENQLVLHAEDDAMSGNPRKPHKYMD